MLAHFSTLPLEGKLFVIAALLFVYSVFFIFLAKFCAFNDTSPQEMPTPFADGQNRIRSLLLGPLQRLRQKRS